MKIEPRSLVAPALALIVVVMVITQTMGALRRSGAWEPRKPHHAAPRRDDPYARLDREIAQALAAAPADNLRYPFVWGGAPAAAVHPAKIRPAKPVPPPRPVLTAILWDNDPRALIHWNDRDYTVRSGDRFAEFHVTSFTREQIVLDRNGESLVLKRPIKG